MLKSCSGSQSNFSDDVGVEQEEAAVEFERVSRSFSESSVELGRFQFSCSCSATKFSSCASPSSSSLLVATVSFAAVVSHVLADKRLQTPGTVLAVKENKFPDDDTAVRP